jgi:hypothetical protein
LQLLTHGLLTLVVANCQKGAPYEWSTQEKPARVPSATISGQLHAN